MKERVKGEVKLNFEISTLAFRIQCCIIKNINAYPQLPAACMCLHVRINDTHPLGQKGQQYFWMHFLNYPEVINFAALKEKEEKWKTKQKNTRLRKALVIRGAQFFYGGTSLMG